jgi:predicted nucleotidyltransferase/DNA-binding XRE family transcriptional regulator
VSELVDIGEALIRRRRALGMSQRDLGRNIGVTQPQIARWEANAYASASLSRVSAAAQALGIDAAVLDATLLAAETLAAYAPGKSPVERALTRLSVSRDALAAFCRSHGIVRLELFGSVLTEGFSAASDVDVLATYAPGHTPGLMQLGDHELELSAMFRRRVDLHTRPSIERSRNPIVRERILSCAQAVYEA